MCESQRKEDTRAGNVRKVGNCFVFPMICGEMQEEEPPATQAEEKAYFDREWNFLRFEMDCPDFCRFPKRGHWPVL